MDDEAVEAARRGVDETPAAQLWSECLVVPQQPAGAGLRLASQRAKQLTTVNRKAVALLLETASLYDAYGQALLHASHALLTAQPAVLEAQGGSNGVNSIQKWVDSQGTTYRHMAKQLRNSTVLPLQKYLVTHGDCATNVQERYQSSCNAVSTVHQKVQSAQKVYQTAENEAEKALTNYRNNNKEENAVSDGSSSPLPKHVATRLSQVLACQARHKRMLDWEQECVRQRQRMEVMALETMQKLEEDRLVITIHSLLKLLTAFSSSSNNCEQKQQQSKKNKPQTGTQGSTKQSASDSPTGDRLLHSLESKNSVDFMIMEEDEGAPSGVFDCDTLGLPLEIGELRDQVRHLATARETSVQTARLLANLLDSVAAAANEFGKNIEKKLEKIGDQSSQTSYNSVRQEMENAWEGECVKELWTILSKSLGKESKEAFHLAREMESLRIGGLNHVIEYGDKVLVPAIKRDDATWKQLCDAARSQSRAEGQYIETTAQSARVRERCKSVGDTAAASASFATANKHVSQSLASMFSILPNGGEHAMKVLDASTRASVAQLSLDEANQKETKDRQLLDSAVALTELSIDAYKTQAEKALEELKETDAVDFGPMGECFVACVENCRHGQTETADDSQNQLAARPYTGVPGSLDAWLTVAKEELKSLQSQNVKSEEPTKLAVQSETVRRALASFNGADADLPMIESDLSMEDATETEECDDLIMPPLTSPLRERAGSASSLGSPTANPNEEKHGGWLLRSLTMPERNDSIFGKLSMKKILPRSRQPKFDSLDTETSIFATFFWPESGDTSTIPKIAESCACSFRDGTQRFPLQYGRLFLSNSRFVFVSWTRKQLALKWSEVLSIESVKNAVNTQEDSIVVKCKKGSSDESYMVLSGFFDRNRTVELIVQFQEQAKISEAPAPPAASDTTPGSPSLPASIVPPDATLARMEVILSRTIRSTTVQQFYDVIWSEGNGTKEPPFYKPFLEQECFDIEVGEWEMNETTRSWCGETYTQIRPIKFKVKRKTHLYIGPPIAEVTQTHCCRVEGKDKCVVQMTVEFEGIPYSDCFAVEIRWVARRVGEQDLKVEVGVEVDFRKTTFLKSKIRSGTIEETAVVHKELFQAIAKACAAAKGGLAVEEEIETPEEGEAIISPPAIETMDMKGKALQLLSNVSLDLFDNYTILACGVLVLLLFSLRVLLRNRGVNNDVVVEEPLLSSPALAEEVATLGSRIDGLEAELKAIHGTLQEILVVLKNNKYD